MDRLARTRSQHFVHSPRRISSPLKARHGSTVNRNPTKRRRLGSAAQHPFARNATTSASLDSDDDDDLPGPSRRIGRQRVLDPEAGAQTINLHRRAQVNGAGSGKKDVKGKGKAAVVVVPDLPRAPPEAVVFSSEEDEGSSPRKRKRTHSGGESEGGTSSWIEMDEDEAEPEFIAEGDQHLIDEAPAYALHRLRKAELIRLWKVAGMWPGDDLPEENGAAGEDDLDDGSLSKRELVDGLISARKPPSTSVDSPSRGPSALGAAFELGPRASTSGSTSRESSASSDEVDLKDVDSTPRAVPRTRAKVKVRLDATAGTPLARRVQTKGGGGVRERLLKARSKSMGGPGEREERKARFGDHVKSPAKGLLNRQTRRASTMSSSTYTTTDTSPPNTPVNSRTPSTRRPRRSAANSASSRRRGSRTAVEEEVEVDVEDEHAEDATESSASDEADPTPLIQRLRPRTRSLAHSDHVSEADADGEEEEDDDELEEGSLFSPGPSSRLRSRDRTESEADVPMSAGAQPPRGAKSKAKEALKGGEPDDEMDVDVDDVEAEGANIVNGDASPPKAQPRPAHKRHTRRNSRLLLSPDPTDNDDAMPASAASSALTPPPPSNGHIETIEEDTENEIARTTRSGRAFGVWQSRRRRLRQEALDDPDMDVDDDEEEAGSDDEDDDSFEADVDLTDATISSLTRLLRDELVQACEARGIEVGGTKPQLAKALIEWRDEQNSDARSTTSSQATARPSSSSSRSRANPKTRRPNGKIIHAIGSNVHKSGQTTPVLLRDHVHAHDPATPPHSKGDSKKTTGEAELNLDLQELGLEDSVIRPDLLQKLERIGSGGFKDVYVGKYKGRKVAISEFREHLSEMDIRELKLLSEFSHPNIVKFRGICIPEDNSQIPCMLVSELCENGDLFDYIRNVECPTLKRVLGLMLDIARGLEYLHTHSPPIIHRDCKSSNILINRAGQAKVGDFGLARVKNSTRSMIRSLVGTVNWQAPELWSPKPQYDYKVDVFSAAMVFWEMLSGWIGDKKYPWEGHNEHYIYDAVGHKHKRPSTAGLRKHWGAEPVNLMERMWHQDSKERPTMTDVVTDLEVLYAAA